MPALQIGFLAFPHLTQLDLTGPYEVLARVPGARVHVLAREPGPIVAEGGLTLLPTGTLADAPPLDVLCVPGGAGVNAVLEDDATLDWLAAQGARARWVTSVCTGALALGAAGLLRGHLATTHWLSLDLLPLFGATPLDERVVVDRNRITGGGVTAGIDFGLTLAARLAGEEAARRIALGLEYAPAPPFPGSPRSAAPAHVTATMEASRPVREERRRLCEAAVARRGSR
jgi:cyclohexyl-isocyanide hydratase